AVEARPQSHLPRTGHGGQIRQRGATGKVPGPCAPRRRSPLRRIHIPIRIRSIGHCTRDGSRVREITVRGTACDAGRGITNAVMRERLLVLALAAGALALFYILLFPKPQQEPDELVLPLSSESRAEGYQGLWRWLGAENIPAVSLRNRYDQLAALLRKPTGNVLIVTMPQRVPVRTRELEELRAWVARGNTLLILAAVEDTPLWMLGTDPLFEDHLEAMT